VLTVLFLAPFFWTVSTSFKTDADIYSKTIRLLPSKPTLVQYVRVIQKMEDFPRFFFNTVNITLWTLVLIVMLSTTSGYAFGRLAFKGQKLFMSFFLLVLTLPYALYLIPIYLMLDKVGLINTHLALILPYAALNLPMSMLIMRGSFKGIPRELEEASIIDGCSLFQTWWKIMVPIVNPSIAVVIVLGFINVWGEFLYGRTLTNTPAAQTLAIGITFLRDEAASWQFGPLSTAITLSIIPPFIIFLVMQRYFVKGIIEGALKG
jgi:ABC-type glycerol-3-phosphate transport system permease component